MTSPARWIVTVSPMRTSSRAISSALCSVAFCTTTPPTVTGSSLATGVSEPVRPTWISMSLNDRGRLLGREFVRDRPARRARHEAEPLLPIEAVDFVDDAVDVVVERRALRLDLAVKFQQRLERAAQFGQRVGLKAASLEPFDHAGLRIRRHVAHLAPGIGEKAERARRGDRGVVLAQRAGRGIARIGKELACRLRPACG